MSALLKTAASAMAALALAGCASMPGPPEPSAPRPAAVTDTQTALNQLPPPARKVVVALYDYPDLTGQFKPSDNVQTLSRAVSQGGANLLINALQQAGSGSWFTVVERAGLDRLLRERAIIREQRQTFAGADGRPLPPPPPLLYAGVILEGGIIGYDTNTITGGAGARYLGIGASTRYRQDTITVSLRATSSQTGEVLRSVSASKTIISYGVQGDTFKFIDFRDLLEVEVGYTRNEPGLIALRRAIEEAVHALIIEGAESRLWGFADEAAGRAAIEAYRARANETAETRPRDKAARS